jgi:hypothetical protein
VGQGLTPSANAQGQSSDREHDQQSTINDQGVTIASPIAATADLHFGHQINAIALLHATEFFVALNKIAAPSCSPREDQSLLMRNLKRLKSCQPYETKPVNQIIFCSQNAQKTKSP